MVLSLIKIASFLLLLATPFIDTRDIRIGSDAEEKEESNSNLIKASPSSKLYFLNRISMGKALHELAFIAGSSNFVESNPSSQVEEKATTTEKSNVKSNNIITNNIFEDESQRSIGMSKIQAV